MPESNLVPFSCFALLYTFLLIFKKHQVPLGHPVARLAAWTFYLINETEPRPDGFRDVEIAMGGGGGAVLMHRRRNKFSAHVVGGIISADEGQGAGEFTASVTRPSFPH